MTQLASNPIASAVSAHLHALAAGWKSLMVRGVCAVLFGVFALAVPALTLPAVLWMFAALAILDGVFALAAAASGRARSIIPTWWLILVGLLGIGVGVTTILSPALTAITLATFVGVWALVRGIITIAGAVHLRKVIQNEWSLIISGLIDVAFGTFVVLRPGEGILAMMMVVGAFAIVGGITLITLALRLKRHVRVA
ncbi:MAG: DUF308 domain-containing protein [Phycisphaerales bacterium]|nr:DUF308 domain-containing protein [Planctomycetota bacterium]